MPGSNEHHVFRTRVYTCKQHHSPLPMIVFAKLLVELTSDPCPSLFGFLAVAAAPSSASSSRDERGSSEVWWRSLSPWLSAAPYSCAISYGSPSTSRAEKVLVRWPGEMRLSAVDWTVRGRPAENEDAGLGLWGRLTGARFVSCVVRQWRLWRPTTRVRRRARGS